ncbi:TorD/DmsD family molecular chaperone [Azospirillum sp.]|uniref:TorD/DmsD family molecular chaperone n=1 Tax=Azospirillum sp. TaxID=34012 RepID=UPI003D758FBD
MAALAQGTMVDDADRLRAQAYTLLAQVLARPPSRALLTAFAGLSGDSTPLGRALDALAAAARFTSADDAEREFNALFIGVVRGELVPYGSYYLSGCLNDRPLAAVRGDLRVLGFERAPGVAEPEDHIATLCEVMAALIECAPLPTQQRFFDRHLAPWAGYFFADLESVGAARLYRPVGTVGRLFLGIERDAFALAPRTAP